MTENWGPYYFVPSSCCKAHAGKVVLSESLDYDLLRQELIASGSPLEVVRISNPWYYRKKDADTWVMIAESSDSESGFPVEWDISSLETGRYEVMGLMHVFVEEAGSAKTIVRQNVAEVLVQN